MELTLAAVATHLGGSLTGNPAELIHGVAPFESAGAGEIALAATPRYLKALAGSEASALIVPEGTPPLAPARNLIAVRLPVVALARALALFHPPTRPTPGVHASAQVGEGIVAGDELCVGPLAVIGNNVRLGRRVVIHAHVTIGDGVEIGDDVEIFPQVVIRERCRIGHRVIIQAGSLIGSDGFGYAHDGQRYHKIRHLGIVEIDDDVEIGAGNTIDRASFGRTHIGRGVKTDNLVHIAHNVTVGEDTVIVAQVGIAGSARVGRHVTLAGQAGISGHLTIGDGATVGPQAGIAQAVPAGATVSGSPEMPHRQWLRVQRTLPRLPELQRRVAHLEQRLAVLEQRPTTHPSCHPPES
jgi:UDP-3-O-[3-hydroxymyristoyl] glucosamine N-acyltransferase